MFAQRSMKTRDLALVEGVLGELLGEANEDGFALLDASVAEFSDCQHEAGKRGEVVALFGGELEEADAFSLVGAGSSHAEDPANGSRFEAEHVVFYADGKIGVVEGGVESKSLLCEFTGEFTKFIGPVLVTVDERGPVGLHTGGDGLAVEGVRVFGVVLNSYIGQTLGLSDAVVEPLFEGWVHRRPGAGGEAAVIGEQLDVEAAKAIELGEYICCGIGGGAKTVFRVRGHPLIEVCMGCGEVQVVEGVVAVVKRRADQVGVHRKERGCQQKEKQKCGDKPDGYGWGPRCNHDKHSFLLPHFTRTLCFGSPPVTAGCSPCSLLRCESLPAVAKRVQGRKRPELERGDWGKVGPLGNFGPICVQRYGVKWQQSSLSCPYCANICVLSIFCIAK